MSTSTSLSDLIISPAQVNEESVRTWPFDSCSNPGICMIDDTTRNFQDRLTSAGKPETCEAADVASRAFHNPQLWRESILRHVRVPTNLRNRGPGYVCIWPTKWCPMGCEFCFFKSPMGKDKGVENTITPEGQERFLAFLQDANIHELVVAGGGEPFLEEDFMNRIAADADVNEIHYTTSGHWAIKKERAKRILKNLFDAHKKNPYGAWTDVRLSLDEYHAARLPGDGLGPARNLMEIFRDKYRNMEKFTYNLHTLEGDTAVERFISDLPVANRWWDPGREGRTEVIELEDGFRFRIRYKIMFDADRYMDLRDVDRITNNCADFNRDILSENGGNQSRTPNLQGEDGGDFLITYDGFVHNWGATAPDFEPSLYQHSYKDVMQMVLDDVIALCLMEKGNAYRESLIAEVNPKAVQRAKSSGFRDFYARICLEEARTRLYVAVRALQDYRDEGRFYTEQMDEWPSQLKSLINTSVTELQKAYLNSDYTIVQQFLENPALTEDDLMALYERVQLGHYDITTGVMIRTIMMSDYAFKMRFLDKVRRLHAEQFGDAMREGLDRRQMADDEETMLLDATRAIWIDQDTLRSCCELMVDQVPSELQPRFKAAFEFLERTNLDELVPGNHPILGDEVYAQVQVKRGKGRDGAEPEVHRDWMDLQYLVTGDGDLIGLNTQGSTNLKGAVPEPKMVTDARREGCHLVNPPDTWKTLSPGEIVMIPPMTPHAPAGIGPESTFKKVIVKVKIV